MSKSTIRIIAFAVRTLWCSLAFTIMLTEFRWQAVVASAMLVLLTPSPIKEGNSA